ncbi:uncharacterized protein (UPF0261 family) [Anseongella ginsenosidimutans]|uniref:Uncharacterized protein (UPF0261 family) n=1 Tax=Anseongella ginsenosidimutans TaxID=496056 RepID=A0A4R3KPW2_9SPHI|nr:Tm-1-like ATP-binding domain-containing protein [Anseongella ginsenosidimutans]QEC52578.1 UPF0261 family protein [Anseongella ginsenosidimutans]TCS86494.1 uncharacterized protein (UPF0261 family) [Anseongella ginsenosidimutans]
MSRSKPAEAEKSIVILGCFDTKGEDFAFLRSCVLEHGEQVIAINTGIRGTTAAFPVTIESEEVALAGGQSISALREKDDRGWAVEVMGKGAASVLAGLLAEGKVKGIVGMGGGGGTFISLCAMQEAPLGIPKLCLSTIAAKDLSRQMGSKDIVLMPSIVDVAGLNSISRQLIRQAAAAICAMARLPSTDVPGGQRRIAISMFGNTTACVDHCREMLEARGYEVFIFHATGVGGRTMESLIREGCFDGVLDITTTELADELCGGICSAGPSRLTAAAEMGIPQVVAPGCLDMVNFAQPDTVPAHYRNRELYSWAPDVTLMRTNEAENRQLGKELAIKLNKAAAEVLLPLKGISQIAAPGGVFYRPAVDQALFEAVKAHAGPGLPVREVDAHINDQAFSRHLVDALLGLMERRERIDEGNPESLN